jgi:hypothetical protein
MAGWFGDEINSRKEFFQQLGTAKKLCADLVKKLPHQDPLKYVAKQLDDIERWTLKGRTPTIAERKSVFLALVFSKEYEMTEDDDIIALQDIASGIDAYVTFWPDDKTAADPANEDYLFLSDL